MSALLPALAISTCLLAHAQGVVQNIATGMQPMAIAVNGATNKAYVVNHDGNSVTVIDGKARTAIATVKTGTGPEGIAINPVTDRVYVANSNENSVTVIDGSGGKVVATVPAGGYCQAIAINTATNTIYIANNSGHSITVIDGSTNHAKTVRVGQGPRAIASNPVTNRIYTANYGSRDVTEVDGASNAAVSIPTGKHPWALAVDDFRNKIYVANEDDASVTIIDGATRATRHVVVGEIPFAVAVNSRTNKIYVLTYAESTVAVIDGSTGTVTKTLRLDAHPSAIAINPETNLIFVGGQSTARVLVIDGRSDAITGSLPVGDIPYAMTVDAKIDQVYVANLSSANVSVIRPYRFRVLALAEPGGIHQSFVDAATLHLNELAAQNAFAVDYISSTEEIDEAFLARYKLFVQLNYPPYRWTPAAKAAFVAAIGNGTIGWIGFHHASLLGEFDGYPMDPWFSQFLGGIRYTNYIPGFARATVKIEDTSSPLTQGLPSSFVIDKEEWYTWSNSPRENVHVLATVEERSYVPDSPIKMGGDHPVIWSNPHFKARNVYIFMGHHGGLFDSPEFTRLFRNSVLWAAGQ